MKIDFNRHIWEGWRVIDFINELDYSVKLIMGGQSHVKPFQTKEELVKWVTENQPYYKKRIPEVIEYFANQYNLK